MWKIATKITLPSKLYLSNKCQNLYHEKCEVCFIEKMIELVEDLENYEAIDYDDFGREVVQFMQVSTKVWYLYTRNHKSY